MLRHTLELFSFIHFFLQLCAVLATYSCILRNLLLFLVTVFANHGTIFSNDATLMFLLFCIVNYLLCFSVDETRFISFEFLLQVSIAVLCQMEKEKDDGGVGGRKKKGGGGGGRK